jgi:hypothetical protein
MADTDPDVQPEQRLTRLRELAASTDDGGRATIQALIDREHGACPRFAGIATCAGERVLVVAATPRELACSLRDLVTCDPPHSIEALVDLDNGERRAAHTTARITFAAPAHVPPPTPEALARTAIDNIQAVAPGVSPDDHDRLASAVEDVISLLARIDPDAAEALEAG